MTAFPLQGRATPAEDPRGLRARRRELRRHRRTLVRSVRGFMSGR